jgi:hypothetical protein
MTDKDLEKFNDIKERFGFLTDAEALRFIINHYYEIEVAPILEKQKRAAEEK